MFYVSKEKCYACGIDVFVGIEVFIGREEVGIESDAVKDADDVGGDSEADFKPPREERRVSVVVVSMLVNPMF